MNASTKGILVVIFVVSLLIGGLGLLIGAINKDLRERDRRLKAGEVTASIHTVVHDGCQYLQVDNGFNQHRVYSLTHKGNCTNEIHSEIYVIQDEGTDFKRKESRNRPNLVRIP